MPFRSLLFRKSRETPTVAPSSQEISTPAQEDEQPLEVSEPEPAEISLERLQISSGISRIGDILKLPIVSNGAVRKGGAGEVSLRCIVTENLRGRNGADPETRERFRFIYLADFTGFINIGMFPVRTGLIEYDVPEEECNGNTRCSFCAHVEGTVSWEPKNRDPASPVFFLNNGYVQKIHDFDWEQENRFMFPTSDVCLQLLNNQFAYSANFSTTGFCGKIETFITNDDGDLLLSLRDPVGGLAAKLIMDEEETAESFLKTKMIAKGYFVFIKGRLDIYLSGTNAVLEGKSSQTEVMLVRKETYNGYLRLLMRTEEETFTGISPQPM